MLRAVWALCRVGSEQNPTPTPLFLLHIIYKNSHLPLNLPTTLLLPPNTITHHQPLALKINIKHFFQWKKKRVSWKHTSELHFEKLFWGFVKTTRNWETLHLVINNYGRTLSFTSFLSQFFIFSIFGVFGFLNGSKI